MAGEPTVERKTRGGVEYWHVTFPSFADGEPEVAVNYWANGRISLGSARIGILLRRLHRHSTGSNVELKRVPLSGEDDDDG